MSEAVVLPSLQCITNICGRITLINAHFILKYDDNFRTQIHEMLNKTAYFKTETNQILKPQRSQTTSKKMTKVDPKIHQNLVATKKITNNTNHQLKWN